MSTKALNSCPPIRATSTAPAEAVPPLMMILPEYTSVGATRGVAVGNGVFVGVPVGVGVGSGRLGNVRLKSSRVLAGPDLPGEKLSGSFATTPLIWKVIVLPINNWLGGETIRIWYLPSLTSMGFDSYSSPILATIV